MSDRIRVSRPFLTAALTAVIATALMVPVGVAAQTRPATTPAAAAKAPAPAAPKAWTKKTPDGQPDIQGYWSMSTSVPLERPVNCGTKEFYTEEEMKLPANQRCPAAAPTAGAGAGGRGAAAAGGGRGGAGGGRGGGGQRGAAAATPGQASDSDVHYDLAQFGLNVRQQAENMRTSLIIGETGRIPPLSAEGQKRQADLAARAEANRGKTFDQAQNRPTTERCLAWAAQGPPMMSPGYNPNMQIVQGKDYVMLMPEMMQDARIIPLDGRPHAPAAVTTWGGDSRGRWEGDTLVVETTNFNGRNPFQTGRGGAVGSEKMKLVERFRRTADNVLVYEFTINDPVWTEPFTVQVNWAKMDGDVLFEYACHEGNYGMYNILSGARAAEKAAAEAKK